MNNKDLQYLMGYGQWLLDKHRQEVQPDIQKNTSYLRAIQTLIDYFVETKIINTPLKGSVMLYDNTPFRDEREILYHIVLSDDDNLTTYHGPKELNLEQAIQSWNREVNKAE